MPHAVPPDDPRFTNEDELYKLSLAGEVEVDFDSIFNERGEKAVDAIDYEDIGDDDDDLAEEVVRNNIALNGHAHNNGERDLNGGTGSDFPEESFLDDLFGDQPSSPADQEAPILHSASGNIPHLPQESIGLALPGLPLEPKEAAPSQVPLSPEVARQLSLQDREYPPSPEDDAEWKEQQRLFEQARLRQLGEFVEPPPAPETNAEIFEAAWPLFDREQPPRFQELLPSKRAFYIGKTPLKLPKPIQPNKVNLELQQDQERSFRLPASAAPSKRTRQAEAEQRGIVLVVDPEAGQQSGEEELLELDVWDDDETIGGITMQDLSILCEEWDIPSPSAASDTDEIMIQGGVDGFNEFYECEGDSPRPTKKRKLGLFNNGSKSFPIFHNSFPFLDDPESTTSLLARKVYLDLNDPNLLVDIQQPNATQTKARKSGPRFRRDVSGSLTKSLFRKYNVSNDEAYDQLKENHQHKVRSTLGNMTVEHSLPALKLQFPFYKVKLSSRDARSFHRPTMAFLPNQLVTFSKLAARKRKQLKGKSAQEIFAKAEDLSLGDNSNMVLLEYSEEYPIMLSNFGMGNRLINYYRRKDSDDNSRPKLDLGETAVLLPQDKSPFSIFGDIEPGQTTPTLHNGMYRAPVFKQEAKSTDFLVGRSTTGVKGSMWYVRNIENLMVVGQEFPSVEVPGTHSRKVTEAAKRRLKMISYRIWTKNSQANVKGPILSNEMIRQHLPGTDIAQNRGKMREFMAYDKENQSWMPKKGDVVPDAQTMRSWIKPEDICLLDSMQVGHRHLQDAGYNKDGDEADDGDDEENAQSLEQQLAPWHTTKNFLNACQGKAMLQLHGEGDPSGRGEAFSFIKTSMKGGFKPVGESIEDKLDAKRLKELGGHSYNVARQQKAYEDAIKKIWEAQRLSLSSTIEHSDTEMDVDSIEEADVSFQPGRTPRSEFGTPAFPRRDDETTSQFSKFSTTSQKGKVLRIVRQVKCKGGKLETHVETITDPKVIREYMKRRRQQELDQIDIKEIRGRTGNAEYDAQLEKKLKDELARLQRNKERRHVREKQKGLGTGSASTPATPGSPSAGPGKGAGTLRRCANCGQVGHIKTNKKLCPLLNGKGKPEGGFDDTAFSPVVSTPAQIPAPAAPAVQPPSAAGLF